MPPEPVTANFFATAPVRYHEVFDISRPAADVWGELVCDEPLSWCKELSIRWTSERPFGVGTTRRAKVLGAMKVQEHFFIWEEGRRHAFEVTKASVPVFRRLAEDFLVEPTGPASCRFTWSVGLEPTPLGRLGGPANALLFKRLFAQTRRHFAAG